MMIFILVVQGVQVVLVVCVEQVEHVGCAETGRIRALRTESKHTGAVSILGVYSRSRHGE